MPDYRAPGVYVEEVPSAVKPIAGVSTSTAAFIGVFADAGPFVPGEKITGELVGKADAKTTEFPLRKCPVIDTDGNFAVRLDRVEMKAGVKLANQPADHPTVANVVFAGEAPKQGDVTVDYREAVSVIRGEQVVGDWVGTGNNEKREFELRNYPVVTESKEFTVTVAGASTPATLANDHERKVAKVSFSRPPKANEVVTVDYIPLKPLALPGEVRLCTSFSDFVRAFGGFSSDSDQRRLAHAVYGFFNNGGTRCYVVRETKVDDIVTSALPKLALIDEIAIVAAPGITDAAMRIAIVNHCEALGDRFAILDGAETVTGDLTAQTLMPSFRNNYAAFYFPWLEVFDPVTDGTIFLPPSGHVAGIYARVDAERGVHKAPANEVVRGALGLKYTISKAQQVGFNPVGINCIRSINNNIQVWGARTLGGDANADLKYVNVRRTLLFLRKSIEQGTQWVVFEPNSPALWQRIARNVTAFLTTVWRSGALFGTTAAEAFYVKCDAETNPPELRDLGQVVTEIGVAIVRPAEFVIFRISQFTASGA